MEKSTKLKVLVVDDQPFNLSLATSVLKNHYEVLLANRGEKAISLCKIKKPDLILLDIMMPDMDGYSVCMLLKSDESTADIPIIFFTAMPDEKSIEKAYESGGVDYIAKPINRAELLSRVKTHLTISKHRQQLEELNESLGVKDLQKNKLLSIISHDTINSIDGSRRLVKILLDKHHRKKLVLEGLEESLTVLYDELAGVTNLLDELIWWSKSQFQQISYRPIPFDYEELINRVAHQLSMRIKTKEITLSIDLTHKASNIDADIDMVGVVIRNLLANAIKFSFRGGEIKVRTCLKDNEIVTSVEDQGIGIAEERQSNIFALSNSSSTTGTQGERGTGLGLNLCQGLVAAWGGRIWLESEQGKGSRFSFSIPT